MKLRILGNSIRLRLSKPEVAKLHETGRVEESLSLSPTDPWDRLSYAIEHTEQVTKFEVSHIGDEIRVLIPSHEVRKWADGELVGMYGAFPVYGDQLLTITVEKDFACLDKSDADNADMFPNPNLTC
ncbi:DUF7009 family protein [Terriglobus tenax]|uniref:DUF7009 family protein n=1 Tax=Terriglobus tenax TaxID=1111115 RepID=UPI0021DF5D98|nr:hypothetical protein [Terriglobus tenax]